MKLQKFFTAQWERLPLFYPVFLGLGIAVYFSLEHAPSLWIGPLFLGLTSLIFLAIRNHWALKALSVLPIMFALGFCTVQLKTYLVKAPTITEATGPLFIEGTIIEANRTLKDVRLVLNDLDLEDFDDPPKRLKVYTIPEFPYTVGDRVSFRAVLMPPMEPLFNLPYRGDIDAYYKQIGGVVFLRGLNTLYKIACQETPRRTIENIRTELAETIYGYMPNQIGAITAALITGKRDKISEKTLKAFQRSGLAHILAISGLHIGMFFGVVLFSVRFLLSLIPPIALYFQTQKIAACFGIIAAFGYTLLAGATYPTIRAFLMLFLIFVAMLLDKRVISLRTLAFAAFGILLFIPEALLTASFQLSFAAVAGLVAFYEAAQKKIYNTFLETGGLGMRVVLYFLGLMASSLIASFATMPFALYHFGQIQIFGIFSNLLAIPLMGILIMPCIVLFCFTALFHFSEMLLTLITYGVHGLYTIAHFVASFNYAALYTKPFMLDGFLIMVCGFLITTLFKGKPRLLGIPLMIIAFTPLFFEALPKAILLKKGKAIVYREKENKVYTNLKKGTFLEKVMTQRYNQNVPMLNLNDHPHCTKKACFFEGFTYIRNKNAVYDESRFTLNPFTQEKIYGMNKNALQEKQIIYK